MSGALTSPIFGLPRGFVYLVAIIDWYSRKVLSWRLSNTLDAGFCVDCLEEAIMRYGTPVIFNSDQGSQFTRDAFTGVLLNNGITISMDGRGRTLDNIFVERLWRTVKYEEVYLKQHSNMPDWLMGLTQYFQFYNQERWHQERQHFSRKLKWGPSDFSSEKFAGGYCLRRPAFVLCPPRHATPLRHAARHGFHNDLTPCRMALYFDFASASASTSSKHPAPTATRGSSYTAPLSLRFLYSFQALAYKTPDEVYKTAIGGGAKIVDKFRETGEASGHVPQNRDSAVQLECEQSSILY
jgi:transposase InsO family protein